jgi:rhodanese-related sulfurtransferase
MTAHATERITVPEARAAMERDPKTIYLDVRTEEEFADGHPEGSINIPVGSPHPATRVFELNQDFAAVARGALPLDTPLLVGCRTGPRAEAAAQILAGEGFTNVRWVFGGYIGITGPAGQRIAPGWLESGLPVSREAAPGAAYVDLRKKAGVTP